MAAVLLVDDDAGQLDIRRRILEAAGHCVFTAATAEEATGIARLHAPRVVVMDLCIPLVQDGLALSAKFDAACHVIVLTGLDAPPAGMRADRVLHKPFPTRELLRILAGLS